MFFHSWVFRCKAAIDKNAQAFILIENELYAKNRANEALKPLGISDVETVNLSPVRYGGYDMQYSARAESFSSAPIFSSSEDVSASVYVVFTIQ